MAKICPETGDVVLYPECLECFAHGKCKPNKDQNNNKIKEESNGKEYERY